jgi:hypothetical protein
MQTVCLSRDEAPTAAIQPQCGTQADDATLAMLKNVAKPPPLHIADAGDALLMVRRSQIPRKCLFSPAQRHGCPGDNEGWQ